MVKIKQVKEEARIIGIDDGHFTKKQKRVIVVGAITRGNKSLDGLLSTKITIDGLDATERMIKMINRSSHKHQLRFIMLNGITFGGFNLVDIKELCSKAGLPVIVFIRKKPNFRSIYSALKKNFKDWKDRWKLIKKAGKVYSMKINKSKVYFQRSGITVKLAKEVIKMSIAYGNTPEPLRLAHIIATGITMGQSKGGV